MNYFKKIALILISGVGLGVGGSSIAGTDTGAITVTADIQNSCTVGDATLNAGLIDPTANADIDFSANFNLTCTAGTVVDIGLDEGAGDGATVEVRKMTGSDSNTIDYTIYQNAGRTTLWGDTIGNVKTITGNGGNQVQTLYGRIPAGQQSAIVDTYSDSVVITVTF